MQELKPFQVTHRQPLRVAEPDLSKATEVQPMLLFGKLPTANVNFPEGKDLRVKPSPDIQIKEVESTPGSDDPKVPDSSATDNVTPSGSDTSESGLEQSEQTNPTPIHPSTLSESPVVSADAVKEQTLLQPPL